MPKLKLNEAEIKESLARTPNWAQKEATIERTCTFKDFAEAIKFVNAVAKAAEAANHHPDIDIRWNKVTLSLTTHDANGLTKNDFELARTIDQLQAR